MCSENMAKNYSNVAKMPKLQSFYTKLILMKKDDSIRFWTKSTQETASQSIKYPSLLRNMGQQIERWFRILTENSKIANSAHVQLKYCPKCC